MVYMYKINFGNKELMGFERSQSLTSVKEFLLKTYGFYVGSESNLFALQEVVEPQYF